jgi:hypothetical protein
VLTDTNLREKLSSQGRKKAMLYSWPRITKQIEAFYYETMEAKLRRAATGDLGERQVVKKGSLKTATPTSLVTR